MKNKSGSGLVFAVVLLFVILGMVITLSSITVLETKMNQKTKSSVGSFYSAESGVEWALNQIATRDSDDHINSIDNWSSSEHKANCTIGDCSVYFLKADGTVITNPSTRISEIKAVRSVGTEGDETQRTIEAAVAANSCKTGWVNIDDGGCNYLWIWGIDLCSHIYWNDGGDHSPEGICKRNGYDTYTGACKTSGNNNTVINGSVVSQKTAGNWYMTCLASAETYTFNADHNKNWILCTNECD